VPGIILGELFSSLTRIDAIHPSNFSGEMSGLLSGCFTLHFFINADYL
jgi:hypothetical protein